MEDKFIVKAGKKLKFGYTTGSCAAAAAKAAVIMLFENKIIYEVKINTPKGWDLELKINDAEKSDSFAVCSVIKDSGDDPDVTDGIKIFARAEKLDENIIKIKGGIGIGIVTKKGLSVSVGEPAINPVPLEMIKAEIMKVKPEGKGVLVEISAPEGVEIAKKTFNPKLGIIGGISVLGTSGIVEPMSEESFKESLAIKLSIMKEEGAGSCVFVPGNQGEKFMKKTFGIPEKRIVLTSNFFGYMFDEAVYYGFNKILVAGHIGKLIKLAGGIFQTHSRIADARREIFASNYGIYSGDLEAMKKIMESNTTEEAVLYIKEPEFFKYISAKIKEKCEEYARGELLIEVILLSLSEGILGESDGSSVLAGELKNE